MPRVKIRVEAFGPLAELSSDHPDASFTMLTSGQTVEGHVTIVEVDGIDPAILETYLGSQADISAFDVLHADGRWSVVQTVHRSDPTPGRVGRETGNPPPFPMVIRDGWIISETTTSHDQLARYREGLERAGVAYEILSIRQSHDPTKLLTDRQRQFIAEALDRGYYDSPRRCSLTDLATALDVNKATASGILHRAEGAIVKEFMAGSSR